MLVVVVVAVLLVQAAGKFSPRIELSEEVTVVYNYTSEHCPNGLERLSYDVADGPPRIFRSPKNPKLLLQFSSVSSGSRGQQGEYMDIITHSCRVYTNSTNSMDTTLFASHEMPFSPWVSEEDGIVYALTDMEFHNTTVGQGGKQLYTATTLFKSTDGGLTFSHALPPPQHVVAAMPYPPGNGSEASKKHIPAFRAVGNIISYAGYYYAMITALWGPEPVGQQQPGRCIMRTNNISDPASWRGWDGRSFRAMMQTYWWKRPDPGQSTCQPVLPSNMTHSTMFYSTSYGRFVVLGTQPKVALFSFDLVRWVNETQINCTTCGRDEYSFVVDRTQPGPNYYTVGSQAYYFYVEFMGPWPIGRNVLRRYIFFGLEN